MSIGHQAKDINAGLDFHGPPDILLMNAKNLGIYIKVNILPQSLAHNHPICWDTTLLTDCCDIPGTFHSPHSLTNGAFEYQVSLTSPLD